MSGPYGGGRAPERACRKIERWPEEDRRLWQAAVTPGDLLEPGGERARYRPTSNWKVEQGYGRYLTYLDGRGLLETGTAADRITPSLVGDYVQSLQTLGNGSQTILARLQDLYEAAVVMEPKRSWSWIRRIASRIRARHVPALKKVSRLVTTDDLVELGSNLMKEAKSASTARLAAITFRDGLLISFVALFPLRRSNVAALELGRHLVRIGEQWWIVIPGSETKNGEPEERPWPECLVPALEEWLTRQRPILCRLRSRWARPIGDALWVSSHGSPMTMQAIYDRIVARTREAFGKPINPHLFRDIAVTTLGDIDPDHVLIAASLLNHRNFSTTERHYLHAKRRKAVRQHQKLILSLRRKSKRSK